jgi:hypothetical protein
MTTAKTPGETSENRRSEQELDRRYGRIAISALVAALPYGGDTSRQTPVPSQTHKDRAA